MSRNNGRRTPSECYQEDEYEFDKHAVRRSDTGRREPPLMPKQPSPKLIDAHLSLRRPAAQPVATGAVEALNMLLQQYQMELPPFEFKTTRDAGGRSIYQCTVQVKKCIAISKEYNKKLAKQAASHQLLIYLHKRYPKLNIPVYEPPQPVLTRFTGNSADICKLEKEIGAMALDEAENGVDDASGKPTAGTEEQSAMAELSHLASKFPGINPPKYLDVTGDDDGTGSKEVLCKLGCEVVKGLGSTHKEARENSAAEMMKLLGQVDDISASVRDFKVCSDGRGALTDSCAGIEYKLTHRNSNDQWATQVKVEAYGTGQDHNDSLVMALKKVKTLVEDTLKHMYHST